MPVSARLDDDLHLIRSEFQEIPNLRVSLEQAQVRWNLESYRVSRRPNSLNQATAACA